MLLLDEPLSNLDANLRIQMRREILDLQRKLSLTTVFVTHDQEEANTTADRIAVLNDGVIQQVGAPMALYDRPANRFVAGFLGAANLIEGVVEAAGEGSMFRAEDGLAIPLTGRAGPGGGRAVMIRPQTIAIDSPGAQPGEGKAGLSGRVEHREFLGNLIHYTVRTGGRTLLVDDSHQTGRPSYDPGTDVALHLAPEHLAPGRVRRTVGCPVEAAADRGRHETAPMAVGGRGRGRSRVEPGLGHARSRSCDAPARYERARVKGRTPSEGDVPCGSWLSFWYCC